MSNLNYHIMGTIVAILGLTKTMMFRTRSNMVESNPRPTATSCHYLISCPYNKLQRLKKGKQAYVFALRTSTRQVSKYIQTPTINKDWFPRSSHHRTVRKFPTMWTIDIGCFCQMASFVHVHQRGSWPEIRLFSFSVLFIVVIWARGREGIPHLQGIFHKVFTN